MATRGLVSTKNLKAHTIFKICELHGQTEFYFYPGHSVSMCKLCTREKRKERLQDPITRKKELDYAKKWQDENKDKIKAHYELSQKVKKQDKKDKIDKFLAEQQERIKYVLKIYDLPLDNVLKKDIGRMEDPTLKEFVDLVRKKKFSKLKAQFAWKRSSLLKYEYGVRDNYKELVELKEKGKLGKEELFIIERIASESQEYAIEEAYKVIAQLDSKFPVSKTIGKKKPARV